MMDIYSSTSYLCHLTYFEFKTDCVSAFPVKFHFVLVKIPVLPKIIFSGNTLSSFSMK